MKKPWLKFGISLCIGLGLLYITLQHFDINVAFHTIGQSHKDYLFIAFLLLAFSYLIRAARWKIWAKGLALWDSFKLVMIGFMGNNVLPARLGELLRAHCSAENTRERCGRTTMLASIVIERILDGLILSFMGLAGLFLLTVDARISALLLVVSVLFLVTTLLLFISIHNHERICALIEKIHATFPGHLTRFSKEKINFFLDGMLPLGSPLRLLLALAVTFIVWGVELVLYYFISNAISPGISWSVVLLFVVVVNFASLFPFTVGGIGAIEGAATLYLVGVGVTGDNALAMVLTQHSYQFFFTTIVGLFYFFSGKYYLVPLIRNRHVPARTSSAAQPDVLEQTAGTLQSLAADLRLSHVQAREAVQLSIVIPAFNEQARLPKTLLETMRWCTERGLSHEVIIADDGSTDQTLEVASLFRSVCEHIKVIACPHQGKGGTVRMGMLNAAGEFVLFMDADGATPLSEIPKFLVQIERGYDIAIGSRVVQIPHQTYVKTSLHRKVIGRTFAAIVNICALKGFADTQCGFKMFRHEVIRDLFRAQKINGFAFDVELLYLAKRLGFSISEIPVNWVNQEGSKVNVLTDSPRMLWDIIRLPWLHRKDRRVAISGRLEKKCHSLP